MSAIEAEIHQAQQEAHKAAQKAEAAQRRLSEAQRAAEAARDTRVREWAERTVAGYAHDVAAGLEKIRQAQQAFYRAAVEDLPHAAQSYVAWMVARHRLRLRYLDQQSAASAMDATGMTAASLADPVPSFAPEFDRALAEAVAVNVRDAIGSLDDAQHARRAELQRSYHSGSGEPLSSPREQ